MPSLGLFGLVLGKDLPSGFAENRRSVVWEGLARALLHRGPTPGSPGGRDRAPLGRAVSDNTEVSPEPVPRTVPPRLGGGRAGAGGAARPSGRPPGRPEPPSRGRLWPLARFGGRGRRATHREPGQAQGSTRHVRTGNGKGEAGSGSGGRPRGPGGAGALAPGKDEEARTTAGRSGRYGASDGGGRAARGWEACFPTVEEEGAEPSPRSVPAPLLSGKKASEGRNASRGGPRGPKRGEPQDRQPAATRGRRRGGGSRRGGAKPRGRNVRGAGSPSPKVRRRLRAGSGLPDGRTMEGRSLKTRTRSRTSGPPRGGPNGRLESWMDAASSASRPGGAVGADSKGAAPPPGRRSSNLLRPRERVGGKGTEGGGEARTPRRRTGRSSARSLRRAPPRRRARTTGRRERGGLGG